MHSILHIVLLFYYELTNLLIVIWFCWHYRSALIYLQIFCVSQWNDGGLIIIAANEWEIDKSEP